MAAATTSRRAGSSWPARVVGAGLVVVAVLVVAIVLFRGDGGYTVTGHFLNGGQLVPGNPVKVAGATVGTVEDLRISDDGEALVRFSVDDD